MPSKLFPTVVLCDLIIRDVSNKHSLIGIYSGDILISEMPARLRLALYTEFLPPEDGEFSIEIDIKLDGKRFAKGEVQIKDASAGVAAGVALSGFELRTDVPVQLDVTATVNGSRPQSILKKKIMKNSATDPSASSPPSAQSPPSVPA
jgi:hypothetical protein